MKWLALLAGAWTTKLAVQTVVTPSIRKTTEYNLSLVAMEFAYNALGDVFFAIKIGEIASKTIVDFCVDSSGMPSIEDKR